MKSESVFFTLYDEPEFRQSTLSNAQDRAFRRHGHRTIRVEIGKDENGIEKIVSCEFVAVELPPPESKEMKE
jgi:hypothetical protein